VPDSRTGSSLPARPQVRVLTFNLLGNGPDWADRSRVIEAGIRALPPDLVAFNECVVRGRPGEGIDQAREVLGDGFEIVHARSREPNDQSACIASRWPIRQVHELDQHVSDRVGTFPAVTMAAEVDAPAPFGRLTFANHMPSWQVDFERERELQAIGAARLLDGLAPDRADHVILAGDLNVDPDAASVRFLCGRQSLDGMGVCYRDAWASARPGEAGDTFTSDNPTLYDWDFPSRRIDYVLVRCGVHGGPTLEILGCRRIFDEPVDGIWASDHFGVFAELGIPRRLEAKGREAPPIASITSGAG